MRIYDSRQWACANKELGIALTTKDFIELDVVGTGMILIQGTTDDGEVIPIICQQNNVHVKHKFNGFAALRITSNKEFGYRLVNTAKQIGEPMDDRTPPPPKEPTNILQQMRSVIKQELAINRENFLVNDTGLPTYETDDEDNFEEEQIALAQQAKKELIDKSRGTPNPEPAPQQAGNSTDEPQPQSASETPPAS